MNARFTFSAVQVKIPNYQRLLDDVRKRLVDVVLVWRYDRFARSTQALINALNEFRVA